MRLLLLLSQVKSEKTLQRLKNLSKALELIGREAGGQGQAEELRVCVPNLGAAYEGAVCVSTILLWTIKGTSAIICLLDYLIALCPHGL